MTKHVSGHCTIGKNMKRWGFREDSKCHSCDKLVEDMQHLLYCPHKDRIDSWEEAFVGFEEWITSVDMALPIQHCIIGTLK
jgi:hypothetical protein